MKKSVTVKINYTRFEFGEDLQGAVTFADTAAKTLDKDDREVAVYIDYEEEEEDS